MQVVKLIFKERGVQFLCSMLSFDSAFFPLQSNYFIDKKLLLMPQVIEGVMLQVSEPCIQKWSYDVMAL